MRFKENRNGVEETIFSTTAAAESGTTQIVSVPARALGDFSQAEVTCLAPGYTAKAAKSDYLWLLPEPAPGMLLNAPATYIKKEHPAETDGYTFTVVLPEEVRDVPVTGWNLSAENAGSGEVYYSDGMEEGEAYTGTFTIPQSSLPDAWTDLSIRFYLMLKGYEGTEAYANFSIIEPDTATWMTITLTDPYGNAMENPVIGENVRVTVTGSGDINALRIWDSYSRSWFDWGKQEWSTTFTADNPSRAFAVYGSADGGLTWTEGYPARTFTFAVAGQLGNTVIQLNKDEGTYIRGQEEVLFSIDRIAHATQYFVYVHDSPTGKLVYSRTVQTDENEEGPLSFSFPTEYLSGGSYYISVSARTVGYKENYSGNADFTITESSSSPGAMLRVYPEQPKASDEMTAYAFIPDGEDGMILNILSADGEKVMTLRGYRQGTAASVYFWNGIDRLAGGTYTFEVCRDGDNGAVLLRKEVTISSEGKLGNVSIHGLDGLIWVGDDISATFSEVDNAESYTAELQYYGDGAYVPVLRKQIADDDTGNHSLGFLSGTIRSPGMYYLVLTAKANGWQRSDGTGCSFLALDPAQQGNPQHPVTLEVLDSNGQATEQTEWYNTDDIRIRITADGATDVRLWHGGEWISATKQDGAWFQAISQPEEGDLLLAAQAKYDPDGAWESTSNIRMLYISGRYLPQPVFTTNADSGTIERGDILKISIGEDPVIADRTAGDIYYEAELYEISEGKETHKASRYWDNETRMIFLPTDNLNTGSYKLKIRMGAGGGWKPGEKAIRFAIAEPETEPASFRISSTRIPIGTPLEIVCYVPGADSTGVTAYDGSINWTMENADGEIGCWGHCFDNTGFFTLTPYAIKDGVRTEGTPTEIEVYSHGQLEAVTFTEDTGEVILAGEDMTEAFHTVDHADRYDITLHHQTGYSETVVCTQTVWGGNDETIHFRFDK